MIEVFVGLGSNLNNPILQIRQAFALLEKIPQTQLIKTSSLYRTKPWGILEQPEFINAVAKLNTTLLPLQFLSELLAIEQARGRIREIKNGPRILDCDLLLYGQTIIADDVLSVPHPQMKKRSFVLLPLAEIEPNFIFPDGQSLNDSIRLCDDLIIEKMTTKEQENSIV